MENGHLDPPEAWLRVPPDAQHPATQAAVVNELRIAELVRLRVQDGPSEA